MFTAKVWSPSEKVSSARKYGNTITVMTSPSFHFLNMEIYWSKKDELHFQVHMKENQVLKYLNKGSCHAKKLFRNYSQWCHDEAI